MSLSLYLDKPSRHRRLGTPWLADPDFRYQDPALRVDSTGHFYGDNMLAATEDGHWVSYVFVNPDTGKEQRKHAWMVLHDGLLFGSGWYEPVEP